MESTEKPIRKTEIWTGTGNMNAQIILHKTAKDTPRTNAHTSTDFRKVDFGKPEDGCCCQNNKVPDICKEITV